LRIVGFVVRDSGPAEAKAEAPRFPVVIGSEAVRLRTEIEAARSELDLANAQLERWHKIFGYSSKYRVGADLATSIYDIASAEGIEPELGVPSRACGERIQRTRDESRRRSRPNAAHGSHRAFLSEGHHARRTV
jgi:hypothetical protein